MAQWGDTGTRNKARAPQDVEAALVWAFRDQAVLSARGLHRLEAQADGFVLQSVSADGIAAIERIGMLGCRVDSSGAGAGHVAPDDALALMRAVMRLDAQRRRLLIEHALRGTVPAWHLGPVRAVPRYEGSTGRRVLVIDQVCPLAWLNGPERVEAARAEYRAWWFGLRDVRADLEGRSVGEGGLSFPLLGPGADPAPWGDERREDAGEVRPGPRAVLDGTTAEAIRERYARGGISVRELAVRFGVSKSTVSRVIGPVRQKAA